MPIAAVCDVNQTARERAIARASKSSAGADPKEHGANMRDMFVLKLRRRRVASRSRIIGMRSPPIWACQSGKDVYVEKPASHNLYEARANGDGGAQVQPHGPGRVAEPLALLTKCEPMQLLQEGVVGTGLSRAPWSVLPAPASRSDTRPMPPVPAGLDGDRFLGPAQWKPYSVNKLLSTTGTGSGIPGMGDIGNQGVHEMDICLWGLGRGGWPVSVSSTGGKYVWQDDQQTPNTYYRVLSISATPR